MSWKENLASSFRKRLTAISPELNIRFVYFTKKKRLLRLKNPVTFSDKLVKLRIENYNHNPLVKKCSDKYAVRDYVTEKGYGELLNELYGAFDNPSQINWNSLPESFVLKLNVGCGYNYLCPDKSAADADGVFTLLNAWMEKKPWLSYAELQYKDVQKRLLVERYLRGKKGEVPEDYKVYCFHGEPLAILYMSGRHADKFQVGFFDRNWKYLGIKQNQKKGYVPFDEDRMPECPQSLSTMLRAAAALSEGFPFVRVDFYEIDGHAVFGEMTFSPSAGYDAAEVDVDGKNMAEYLHV